MKQLCILCERKSSGGPLWCQESYCSVDNMAAVFDYGESIGDLSVVKALAVLRTSTIYEAERSGEKVLLKIAHDGFQERLKREATFLMQLQGSGQYHPMLPTLLSPHEQASVTQYPYGKTVFNEQTKYYCLFAHAEGDFLRDVLLKNPQPWYQHAGWLIIGLADVVALMHQQQKLHLCLCPEIVFVRFDKQGVPRSLLLDLGAVADPQRIDSDWRERFIPPAYTAPELIRHAGQIGSATDVYGLGLILYEMLAGRPAYTFRLQNEADVRRAVVENQPAPVNRPDLKNVPAIAEKAIRKMYNQRQPDVVTFASELLANFPPVPKEKKEWRINWRTVALITGAALVITLLLFTAVLLSEATP